MATIRTIHKGDMLFESTMGNHKLIIDVPAEMGGTDRGPQPPQIFIASLGSCVAALVANYCQTNNLNTDGLAVDVSFDKVENPTRLVNIKISIHMPCDDFKAKEHVLMRVAEHCPVHESIIHADKVEFEFLVG